MTISSGWRQALPCTFFTLLGFWISIFFSRLVIGVLTIDRIKRGSVTIDDEACLDLVAILRAKLSCRPEVIVRESKLLNTPAVVGWRRPFILLPSDRRSWTEIELKAAMSHEIAQIKRADYATGLLMQRGLILNIYNPIDYWILRRFRLDQELSADELAARLVGGRVPYLSSLARLVLRREQHER